MSGGNESEENADHRPAAFLAWIVKKVVVM